MKFESGCPSCSSLEVTAPHQEDYRLSHWPIQIKLMGSVIPFLNDADLLVAADCTAFAAQNFHKNFLKDKKVLIGCPKLDDATYYVDKFTEIFSNIPVKSVQCLRMVVPCCGGMTMILKEAIKRSGKNIPLTETTLDVKGDMLGEKEITG